MKPCKTRAMSSIALIVLLTFVLVVLVSVSFQLTRKPGGMKSLMGTIGRTPEPILTCMTYPDELAANASSY